MKVDRLGRKNSGFAYINANRHKFEKKRVEKITREFDRYQTFMLTDEMADELKAKAKGKKIPIAELIRTYIEWGLENDK